MSWHVAGYTGSIGNVANTDLPAGTDDVLTILNSHYVLRKQMKLAAIFGLGGQLTRLRLDSPTIRYYGQPQVRPFSANAHTVSNDNVDLALGYPFTLPPGEEIAVQVTNGVVGPTRTQAFIFLQENVEQVPAGNIYPVRFTSTTAAVVNSWTTLTYTMDQGLPTGGFMMVYSELMHTNAMVHRWIFDEQVYRPGYLSLPATTGRTPYEMQKMAMGVMGRFINTSLPRLQVWTDTADAVFEGYMYIIPLGKNITSIEPAGQPYLAA